MTLRITSDTQIAATTGQKRLWLAQELNRDDTAYNLHWCTRLRGALDMDKFGEALALVQARHAALHSRFVYQDGELWLVADPSLR